jgi:hypothetical protein
VRYSKSKLEVCHETIDSVRSQKINEENIRTYDISTYSDLYMHPQRADDFIFEASVAHGLQDLRN